MHLPVWWPREAAEDLGDGVGRLIALHAPDLSGQELVELALRLRHLALAEVDLQEPMMLHERDDRGLGVVQLDRRGPDLTVLRARDPLGQFLHERPAATPFPALGRPTARTLS